MDTRAWAAGLAALVLALALGTGSAFAPIRPAAAQGAGSAAAPPARCGPDGGFRPPVPGMVTRLFDPPQVRWAAGHRGIDLAAEPGDDVHSPGPGVVTFAGPVAGRSVVTVQHIDGLRSSVEPVQPSVVRGDEVDSGTVIGTVQGPGSDGSAPAGNHAGVHWGVRDGPDYLDPLGLLRCREVVVLLP